MNVSINIPRIPSFVKVFNIERVFKETFGDIDVNIDIIIKHDKNMDVDYEMLFVHLVANETNEELVEYNKRIEDGEEVWFYYNNSKNYFKTRKLLNKTQNRMISKTDMEEIKKTLKPVKSDVNKEEE